MTRDNEAVNILVVDDESAVRFLLKQILERNGYACLLAENAREARARMSEQSFHLMLCDIQMPEESGLELARHVLTRTPDTAVVMVTVIEDQETAKEVLDLGVYGYLLKPFDENQLLISVANALRRRELEIKQRDYRHHLENRVEERTAELRTQKKELEEVNSAVSVLLRKREEDKASLEENILLNIKQTIQPFLEKLKQSPLSDAQRKILHTLETNIREMASPFVKELSSSYLDLTPTEIRVAGLIKEGRSTKEIADLLCLSRHTITSHRYKIRRKLGLLNKKKNLRSFLHSLHE